LSSNYTDPTGDLVANLYLIDIIYHKIICTDIIGKRDPKPQFTNVACLNKDFDSTIGEELKHLN
jgi:hypothetical protein